MGGTAYTEPQCLYKGALYFIFKANAVIRRGCKDDSAHFQRKHSFPTFKCFYSLGWITPTSRDTQVRANIRPKRNAITNMPPNMQLKALPVLCIRSKNRYHPNTAFFIFSQQMYLDNFLRKAA